MKQLADGVWHLNTLPIPAAVNAYLVEDVLIDAGTRHSAKGILRDLEGHGLAAHALTHAHADHQGSSHEVCTKLGVPYWVPAGDAALAEQPDLIKGTMSGHPVAKLFFKAFVGPGHRVDRELGEGDDVAGFRVIDAPGHSPGQVVFWRESDRVLIIGDVLNDMDVLTGIPGLRLPKDYLTADPAQNRRSAKKLAALEPNLVLFGHGRPLRDTRKFVDFLNALPD